MAAHLTGYERMSALEILSVGFYIKNYYVKVTGINYLILVKSFVEFLKSIHKSITFLKKKATRLPINHLKNNSKTL